MNFVDLHLHSNYSDGTWSPQALVKHAIKLGLKRIAITDHDSVDGIASALKEASTRIELIEAVEISALRSGKTYHVLGYFIDRNNSSLKEVLDFNCSVRRQFAEQLVSNMNRNGMTIKIDDILAISQNGTIGKAHITKAIVCNGIENDITSAYERFFKSDSPFYIERLWADVEKAINCIKEAGGLAILAHPGYDSETESILLELKDVGLDGIEIYHSYHSEQDREQLLELSHKYDFLVSGGSDCHGPYEGSIPYMGSQKIESKLLSSVFTR